MTFQTLSFEDEFVSGKFQPIAIFVRKNAPHKTFSNSKEMILFARDVMKRDVIKIKQGMYGIEVFEHEAGEYMFRRGVKEGVTKVQCTDLEDPELLKELFDDRKADFNTSSGSGGGGPVMPTGSEAPLMSAPRATNFDGSPPPSWACGLFPTLASGSGSAHSRSSQETLLLKPRAQSISPSRSRSRSPAASRAPPAAGKASQLPRGNSDPSVGSAARRQEPDAFEMQSLEDGASVASADVGAGRKTKKNRLELRAHADEKILEDSLALLNDAEEIHIGHCLEFARFGKIIINIYRRDDVRR
jgi:hypothetical protein